MFWHGVFVVLAVLVYAVLLAVVAWFVSAGRTPATVVRQGRIYAGSADEAAMKLRGQYKVQRLFLKEPIKGWFEYTAVVEER